jgi:hypothetical protein
VAAESSSPIAVPHDALVAARDVLRETFGHTDFRGLQAGVIGEVLAGRSALAVLPTGGGKSLCATPDCCKADTWSAIRAIRGDTTRPRPGRSSEGIGSRRSPQPWSTTTISTASRKISGRSS